MDKNNVIKPINHVWTFWEHANTTLIYPINWLMVKSCAIWLVDTLWWHADTNTVASHQLVDGDVMCHVIGWYLVVTCRSQHCCIPSIQRLQRRDTAPDWTSWHSSASRIIQKVPAAMQLLQVYVHMLHSIQVKSVDPPTRLYKRMHILEFMLSWHDQEKLIDNFMPHCAKQTIDCLVSNSASHS